MGEEVRGAATIGGATHDGRALREASELLFRSRARLAIPFSAARSTLRSAEAAGRAAAPVDVKVVAFSATHAAETFVVPAAKRSA